MNDVIHIPELALRQFRIAELDAAAQASGQRHLSGCSSCRSRLQALEQEQRAFEAEIPFERFVGGVNRAARARPPLGFLARPTWLRPALSLAAVFAILAAAGPLLLASRPRAHHRTKGAAAVEVRVSTGENGPQRVATPGAPEALARGERVRIGVLPEGHRYLVAVSVDAGGKVTPLYPETGVGVAVSPSSTMQYLPGSLEFTGPGLEDVVVVLTDAPLTVETLAGAASAAYGRAHGDLHALGRLEVGGEQFQQLLLKP